MKKRVLKHYVTNRFRRGLAAFLCVSTIITSSGFRTDPVRTAALAAFSEEDVYDVLLDAMGIQADGVSSADAAKIYRSIREAFDESSLEKFDEAVSSAIGSGRLEIADKEVMGCLYQWVESVSAAAQGAGGISTLLGLEDGSYAFSKAYEAVTKYGDTYDVVTPTNTYRVNDDDEYVIGGVYTFDLSNPNYKPVNCTEGTSALYSRESIEGAAESLKFNEARVFNADTEEVVRNESSGFKETTPATKTKFGPEDYDGLLHVHTGNELTGSGCYSKRGFHVHRESCKTYKYAVDYSRDTVSPGMDLRIMTVSAAQTENGWTLTFVSDGLTESTAFMKLNTDSTAAAGNHNWYIDYDGGKHPAPVEGSLSSNYKGYASLDAMFGSDCSAFAAELNNLALDIKKTGESADSKTFTKELGWVDFYNSFKTYLHHLGYKEAWCPAHSQHEVYTCGMTTESVVGFSLGCGKENGKYYKGKEEVSPESSSVVTDARLLHPQQTLSREGGIDTRVVLTYLDGHTETVNAKATEVAVKYKITSNYQAASTGVADGYVFPYKITVSTLFGDTVAQAKASGNTDRKLWLLARFMGDQDSFGDDTQEDEETGKNEEIAGATETEHTDSCYAGVKHVHDASCVPQDASLHSHGDECRYNFYPDENDLQVKVRKLASTIDVIYYSPTALYKTCYRIEAGYDTASVTKASSAYDGVDADTFSASSFTTIIEDDGEAFESYEIYDRIHDGSDRDFPFNTFCNKVFDQAGALPLQKEIYGLSDTCFEADRPALASLAHEFACGKTAGGYYDDVFTCGKEEGKYYDASGEVGPVCDMIVTDVTFLEDRQTIYGQQHICTDVRLTYLDGHVCVVNEAGSDEHVTVSTTYSETDLSHLGETAVYSVSVNCLYGQTALTASRQTFDFPVSVYTVLADGLELANKTQVIVQGEELDYSGTVMFAGGSISTEQYQELTAEFSDDLGSDATGKQTVTVQAKLGSSVVKDTVDVWVIPAPSAFAVTAETPDAAAGEVPTYSLQVEYGDKGDPAYRKSTKRGVTWDSLVEGVDLNDVQEYGGVSQEYGQHVVCVVTNSAVALGETGTDYNTGGRYELTVMMSGNADFEQKIEQLVHDSCTVNSSHENFYADSCPVCDYQDSSSGRLEELTEQAGDIVNGLDARIDIIKTSYSVDDLTEDAVSQRYQEEYLELLEIYNNAVKELEDLSSSIGSSIVEVTDAFNSAVTIDGVEKLFLDFQETVERAGSADKQKEYDGIKQKAVDAFERIAELAGQTDLIMKARLTMKLKGFKKTGDTSGGARYTAEYTGDAFELDVEAASDTTAGFDSGYLASLPCRIEVMKNGSYTELTDEIRNAGTYFLKFAPQDGEYKGFTNPYVELTITPVRLKLESGKISKEYDGTDKAVVDFSSVEGVKPCDAGKLSVDADASGAKFSQAAVGNDIPITFGSGLVLTGEAAGNYSAELKGSLTGDILPKKLLVSCSGTKEYDGKKTVAIELGALSGAVPGEDVGLSTTSVTAEMEDTGVGENKFVKLKGSVELTGASAGNYELELDECSVTVTQKKLEYTVEMEDRVYDKTTRVSIELKNLAGVVSGDSVRFRKTELAGNTADADAGNGKPVTLEEQPELAGDDSGNYAIDDIRGLQVDILPKELTYEISSGKVYDTNTDAVIMLENLEGVLEGDSVSFAADAILGEYDSKNAGTRTVTPMQEASLAGNEHGNYSIRKVQPFKCRIEEKDASCVYTAVDKVYDGSTKAVVAVSDLKGIYSGDDAALAAASVNGVFESPDRGKEIRIVSHDPAVLAGADALNYVLAENTEALYADITGASLTVSGSAVNREYNGKTTVSVKLEGLSGARPGADVALASDVVEGTVETKDIGNGKVVTVPEIGLTGADADQYSVNISGTILVDILPKEVVVAAKGTDRVYDGTTDGSIVIVNYSGIVEGDDAGIESSIIPAVSSSADAGERVELVPQAQPVLYGADSGNYVLQKLEGSYAAKIDKRPIFVSAQDIGPFEYGTVSEKDLRRAVKMSFVNILPEEYEAVTAAMEEPEVADLDVSRIGTFKIAFVEGTGDPTSNYEFNYSRNLAEYTITAPSSSKKVTLHTEYKDWYVKVDAGGEISSLRTDENGFVDVYVREDCTYVKVTPIRPVPGGVSDPAKQEENREVPVITGMSNAKVDVTVGDDVLHLETDEDGRVVVPVKGGGSVTVTIEKTGTVDGGKDDGVPAGTIEKYHIDEQGNVTDVVTGPGTIILGKDEEGNYWQNSTKHPVDPDDLKDSAGNAEIDKIISSGGTVTVGREDGDLFWKDDTEHPVNPGSGAIDSVVDALGKGESIIIGKDENGIYWEDSDGKKYPLGGDSTGIPEIDSIISGGGTVIVGKDEDGNPYWKDDTKRPADGDLGGTVLGGIKDTIKDGETVTVGRDENGIYWEEESKKHPAGGSGVLQEIDKLLGKGETVTVSRDEDGMYWEDSGGVKHRIPEGGTGIPEIDRIVNNDGTVTIGKDSSGNLYWEDSTKHHVKNDGVSIGSEKPVPDKIIVTDGYDGIINLDNVDMKVPDGPYIDIVDGKPQINIEGDNSIAVPDGSAGIHVSPGSEVIIGPPGGTGNLDITHVDKDGEKVENPSASGIGGNAGEASGNVTIEGGNITTGIIGNAPGFIPTEDEKGGDVIIAGGNVDAGINSDKVTDADGNVLAKVEIDVSAVTDPPVWHGAPEVLNKTPLRVTDGHASVWVPTDKDSVMLMDSAGNVYKVEIDWETSSGKAEKGKLPGFGIQIAPDGTIVDAITGNGTVTITTGKDGNTVWKDKDGVHPVLNGGLAVNGGTTADNIIVDGYSGTIILDNIDVLSPDGPYIDIVQGVPKINLSGDNRITVPDGSAGIHVSEGAGVIIEGSGTISVIHIDKDGNKVKNPTAAGIGGNAGENSGNITINGGIILEGSVGSAPGVKNPTTQVVINSGVVNVPVNAGSIKDKDGMLLKCVVIDASAAVNKNNIIATKINDKSSTYYKVAVGADNTFIQWVPADTVKIWCYSDSVLYSVALDSEKPVMVPVSGQPVDPGRPSGPSVSSRPAAPGTSGGSGSSGGSGTPGASSTASRPAASRPSAASRPAASRPPSGQVSPTQPGGSTDGNTGITEAALISVITWLNLSVADQNVKPMLAIGGSLVVGRKKLNLHADALVSFDGKNYSSTVTFPYDGYFNADLFLSDKTTQTMAVVRGVSILVDTKGPEIELTNRQKVAVAGSENSGSRVYSKSTVELYFNASDDHSGVKAMQYKLVESGQKAGSIAWKTYRNGSRIKVSGSGVYRVYARAFDAAGNKKSVKTDVFCVDKDKPKTNVKNLHWYKKGQVIKASDTCGVKDITLDGKRIKNLYKVTKTGWHKLVVTDNAGRRRTVYFVVTK